MAESGTPVDKSASVAQTAPKVITGVETDPDKRVLILKVRGPLDVTDTIVHLSFAMLKNLGGQMMEQEGRAEAEQIAAAHKVGLLRPH